LREIPGRYDTGSTWSRLGAETEPAPAGASSAGAGCGRQPTLLKFKAVEKIGIAKGYVYMPSVRVRENEPFEVALRRFKRTIEKTGLLTELRAREFYEKPTSERKRKLAAAVKRHYKRLRSQQLPPKLY